MSPLEFILDQYGIAPESLTTNQRGKIQANLTLLQNLCPAHLWGTEFLLAMAYPEDQDTFKVYPFLEHSLHYRLLQQALDEIS